MLAFYNTRDAVTNSAREDVVVKAGIPIACVNTMVESDKLSGYVESEDVSAGKEIIKIMIDFLEILKP